jgi:hypothetical protein
MNNKNHAAIADRQIDLAVVKVASEVKLVSDRTPIMALQDYSHRLIHRLLPSFRDVPVIAAASAQLPEGWILQRCRMSADEEYAEHETIRLQPPNGDGHIFADLPGTNGVVFRFLNAFLRAREAEPERVKAMELAQAIADECARADIECHCAWSSEYPASRWFDTATMEDKECEKDLRPIVDRAVAYLDARGLLVRLADQPNFVQIKAAA